MIPVCQSCLMRLFSLVASDVNVFLATTKSIFHACYRINSGERLSASITRVVDGKMNHSLLLTEKEELASLKKNVDIFFLIIMGNFVFCTYQIYLFNVHYFMN